MPPDDEIRREITGPLLLENFMVDPGSYQVTVKDGIVTLAGTPETDAAGREIIRAVRHLDGVVAVRDRLDYLSVPPRAHLRAPGLTTTTHAQAGGRDEHRIRHRRGQRLRAADRRHYGRDPARRGGRRRRGPRDARGLSPDNMYLRFFTSAGSARSRRPSGLPGARRTSMRPCSPGWRPDLVGVASYEVKERHRRAEVAFAVAGPDARPGHRHAAAGAPGVARPPPRAARFTAETLSENTAMLRVFADAGLPVASAATGRRSSTFRAAPAMTPTRA